MPVNRWNVCVLGIAGMALGAWVVEVAISDDSARRLLQAILLFAALLQVAWSAKRVPHMIVLLVATVGSLALAEVLLRALGDRAEGHDELFLFDPVLGWTFEPGKDAYVTRREYRSHVKINSRGFRDAAPEPTADAPLLAVLGDSFTSNLGVREDEVFTHLLDRRLPQVTVKNFWVNGYGQVQQLLLLEQILETHGSVDVLVVLYVRNDFDDNTGRFDWNRGYARPRCEVGGDAELRIISDFSEPGSGLWTRFRETLRPIHLEKSLKNALRRVRKHAIETPDRLPPEIRFCRIPLDPSDRGAVSTTKVLLEQLRDRTARAGGAFGVVIAPTLWQVHDTEWNRLLASFDLDPGAYDRRAPQDELLRFCDLQEIPCLDLLPDLRQHAAQGERLYYPREQHWNAVGNRRVADGIQRWLAECRFVGPMNRKAGVHRRKGERP